MEKRAEVGQRGGEYTPVSPGGGLRQGRAGKGREGQDRLGDLAEQPYLVGAWGAGDVGPVQPWYESGDTDAMLNAFNRDTHRALADWVGDREP